MCQNKGFHKFGSSYGHSHDFPQGSVYLPSAKVSESHIWPRWESWAQVMLLKMVGLQLHELTIALNNWQIALGFVIQFFFHVLCCRTQILSIFLTRSKCMNTPLSQTDTEHRTETRQTSLLHMERQNGASSFWATVWPGACMCMKQRLERLKW